MNYDRIRAEADKKGIQILLGCSVDSAKELILNFKKDGYRIFLSPTIEGFDKQVKVNDRVLLLLPELMDGYLSVIWQRRLKSSVILTLSNMATSKAKCYVHTEVE